MTDPAASSTAHRRPEAPVPEWLRYAAIAASIAVIVLAVLFVMGAFNSGPSLTSRVRALKGDRVAYCEKVGFMVLAGKRDLVYGCYQGGLTPVKVGCFVSDSGLVSDVTKTFRALIRLQGQTATC